jgi:hypothetical protein
VRREKGGNAAFCLQVACLVAAACAPAAVCCLLLLLLLPVRSRLVPYAVTAGLEGCMGLLAKIPVMLGTL